MPEHHYYILLCLDGAGVLPFTFTIPTNTSNARKARAVNPKEDPASSTPKDDLEKVETWSAGGSRATHKQFIELLAGWQEEAKHWFRGSLRVKFFSGPDSFW